MTRSTLTIGLILALTFALLLPPLVIEAQPTGKVWRLAFLGDGSAAMRAAHTLAPFREGLRELGYVEGQNVMIEDRWPDGQRERLPVLAEELVRLQVDAIVTYGVPAARALKAATTTIPIVVAVAADMVGAGLVESLPRPGGNVTGISDQITDLSGKNLQFLQELLPGLKQIALLRNPINPGAERSAEAIQTAAHDLGLQVRSFNVRSLDEIAEALTAAAIGGIGALIVVHDALMTENRTHIAQLAVQHGLPAVSANVLFAEAGGLMGYGPDHPALFKRAAVYVDKILKGAKPADLPVEQPLKFKLVINLKTAQALGLTVPSILLFQADDVIR
jgi:putative ABC transport system substrate-binding protein